MRRGKLMLLAMALIAGWLINAQAAGTAGKITRATGKVTVHRGGAAIAARPGMGLNVGDIVQTEAGSYAKFLMSDGTMINVAPGSKVRVKSYSHDPRTGQRAANYDLVYGRGRAQVPKAGQPAIRFSTPTAVAGVRGTELIFSFDPATGQTTIVAVDGVVDVVNPDQPGQTTTLNPGMATTIGTGMVPTPPVLMSAGEINNLRQGAVGSDPSPRTTVVITIPGTGSGDFKFPEGYQGTGNAPGNDGVIGSPQDLINQEPPPFTPVIININLL